MQRGILEICETSEKCGKIWKFLQGLTTNCMNDLSNSKSMSKYTGFLTPQGRLISDAFVYSSRRDGHDEKAYIECSSGVKSRLMGHLSKYNLRSMVKIRDISERVAVVPWKESMTSIAIAEDTRSVVNGNQLQYRSIVPLPFISEKGPFESEKIEKEYKRKRIEIGIAESPFDIIPDISLPLECNLDLMGGIDFHKGCYLGQELTIRTYHRGVIRKRVLPFRLEQPLMDEESWLNSQIFSSDPSISKPIGKISSVSGCLAMGLIRLEHASRDDLYIEKSEGSGFLDGSRISLTLRKDDLNGIKGLSETLSNETGLFRSS